MLKQPGKNHPLVEVVETTTAEEFLNALNVATSQEVDDSFPGAQTLYSLRGVSDFTHDLVPRSLRADGRDELFRYSVPGAVHMARNVLETGGPNRENVAQVFLEFGVLVGFCVYAHRNGLSLPKLDAAFTDLLRDADGVEAYLRHQMLSGGHNFLYRWPVDELLPPLAIAQHYGLPTRLLDWTRDINTAAYFAASKVVEQMGDRDFKPLAGPLEGNLAVWIFRESDVARINAGELSIHGPLVMPMPPYGENPYLCAQQGVFTLWRDIEAEDIADSHALPDLIFARAQRNDVNGMSRFKFVRVQLPKREAPRLLRVLLRCGCDASRLFPGYVGAALAVKESACLRLLLSPSAGELSDG